MEKNQDNINGIREYLLGILNDPENITQIETRLFTDERFGEELAEAEDILIEEYLDGELSQAEITQFEAHFLAAPQRKRHLRLNQNLRKIAASEAAAEAAARKPQVAAVIDEPENRSGWFIPIPAFGFALVALLVAGFGYGLVQIVLDSSINVDAEIAELAVVYKGARPFKARITGFDHAKESVTRSGPSPDRSPSPDEVLVERQRELAAGKLEEALETAATPNALYGRGKAFLAEDELPQALSLLERAVTEAPEDARIQSDLGSAYLAIAENASEKEKQGLLMKALGSFDSAILLNPKLREPYFNRALALEMQGRIDDAKQAWGEYLKIDPDSAWASEANKRLSDLEGKETGG